MSDEHENQAEATELLARAVNHMRQQSEKIIQLSQGMMALIVTLDGLIPGFEDAYRQHYADAGQRLKVEGVSHPVELFDQLLARFRNIDQGVA